MSASKPFDAEAYVAAAMRALDLAIDPAWRQDVVANLKRTAELAQLVLEFELGDCDEPANVFRP